jgi:hypothetical protein
MRRAARRARPYKKLARSRLTLSGILLRERLIQRLLLGAVATCLIGLETEHIQARAANPESTPSPAASAPGTTGPGAPAPAPSIVPPRPLVDLTAEYPEGASGNHDSVVELVVGVDGVPSEVRSLDDVAPFAAAAVAAAHGWRFLPAERDGKPVAARIRLSVSFIDPGASAELGIDASGEALPGAAAGAAHTPGAVGAAAPPGQPAAPVATAEPALAAPEPAPLEVTVAARRTTSATRFTRAEVRELPGAFGDAFRAIEAMPGVTPIASGLPYFFVRGAPPGNLGYFIDGLSIPTLYHVAVGPSVIHPAFIESVDLFSGAYPARYGRFAGAVIAGTSRAPSYELRGEANVRLVDSGAFLEVPFADQRGSVMLAGRYSYTAALVSLLVPEIEVGYWDYQARIRYKLSDDDTLTLFGFGAHDFLSAEDEGVAETVYDVTFHRMDLNWQRTLSADSALQVGASLGWDQTGSGADDTLALQSQRIGTRVLYTRQVSPGVQLRAGADLELSRFDVDITEGPDDDDDDDDGEAFSPERQELPFAALPIPELEQLPITRESFTELFASRDDLLGGGWLDWVLELGRGVTLTPGFRFDFYRSGSSLKLAPEPRISARFQLNDRFALLHDIGIAHQAPSFAIPVPGFSGTAREGLQRGVQTSAGAHWQVTETTRAQLTLFQTALFAGSDPIGLFQLDNSDISVDAATARVTGHTYGAELYLKRDLTRRFGGFISYTLSRSTRTTARLEGPSSADRTHVLNVAAAYRLGQSWRLGGRFMFYSGIPAEVAYPRAAQSPPRGPVFLRLDWRLEKRWRLGSTGFWALVLEVQNTTLARETLDVSCYAYGCESESIGPVTLPSLGLEASF